MLELFGEASTNMLIGLVGGIVLGLAARVGRFCTLGAIEDLLYSSDDRRIRMWGLAIGVAIIGVHIALSVGMMDSAGAAYLNQGWSPTASVTGGLMFGYGMALSGCCGYGALARLGGGDLRAFVIVVVIGLSAYIVMSGPLAHTRVLLFPTEENIFNLQGFGPYFEAVFGLNPVVTGCLTGGIIIGVSLASAEMRRSLPYILWGCGVGLTVASGWVGTYWVATAGFEAQSIESHSFAAPIGDTIFYAMTASGTTVSFSVGSVVGVVVGAFLGSLLKGQFRWEACEDPRELKRQIVGAVFMGVGAILAVGCSIGQGISAFSVLAFSAPVTFVAIFLGASFGLKQLITGFKLQNSN